MPPPPPLRRSKVPPPLPPLLPSQVPRPPLDILPPPPLFSMVPPPPPRGSAIPPPPPLFSMVPPPPPWPLCIPPPPPPPLCPPCCPPAPCIRMTELLLTPSFDTAAEDSVAPTGGEANTSKAAAAAKEHAVEGFIRRLPKLWLAPARRYFFDAAEVFRSRSSAKGPNSTCERVRYSAHMLRDIPTRLEARVRCSCWPPLNILECVRPRPDLSIKRKSVCVQLVTSALIRWNAARMFSMELA